MRITIKTKIVFGIFIGVTLFISIAAVAFIKLLSDISASNSIASVESSVLAFSRFEEKNMQLLSYQAKLIAQTPHLKATLNIPNVDTNTLEYLLQDMEVAEDISIIMLFDDLGSPLVSTAEISEVNPVPQLEGLEIALEGGYFSGYWQYGEEYYAISLAPSVIGQQLLGVVLVGRKINNEWLALIKDITGSNAVMHIDSATFDLAKTNVNTSTLANTKTDLYINPLKSLFSHQNSAWYDLVNEIEIREITFFIRSLQLGNTSLSVSLYQTSDAVAEHFKVIYVLLFVGGLSFILLGLYFSIYISKKISNPVLSLISATQELAKGNFSFRVDVASQDEVGDLTKAVNKMASDIEEGRHDLIIKEEAEREMRKLAYIDSLTDLPNRRFFNEKLESILLEEQGKNYFSAVFFIDIDNFKRINDSLGHVVGDELLILFGERLNTCIRTTDLLAKTENHVSRLGGDEFTILLNHITDRATVTTIANRIIAAYIEPFTLNNQKIVVTGSVGIATSEIKDISVEKMLKCADLAMYEAKNSGKNNYCIYADGALENSVEMLSLEIDLRHALERGELKAYFQPIVDLKNNKIIGAEALARWHHPVFGVLQPDKFIPIAESTGLICRLGEVVLDDACKYFKRLQNSGIYLEKFSVNFSALQFSQSNVYQTIFNALTAYDIVPQNFVMEITETFPIESSDEIQTTFKKLKLLGIKIAIDDFGTGECSLQYVSIMPLDYIKIDRSFVSKMCENKFDRSIVNTIIILAKALDIDVIAEGVENSKQLSELASSEVRNAQGFYFGKPSTIEQFQLYYNENIKAVKTNT